MPNRAMRMMAPLFLALSLVACDPAGQGREERPDYTAPNGADPTNNDDLSSGERANDGDRMNGDRMNERMNGDRMNGDRMNGDRMNGDHMNGDHMNGDHMNGDRLNGDPSTEDELSNDDPSNTGVNRRDQDMDAVTPGDQEENASDLWITAEIRRAIMADDAMSINAQNSKVITANGITTLRGVVNSEEEKAAIEAKALAAAGVGNVVNQLEVQSSP